MRTKARKKFPSMMTTKPPHDNFCVRAFLYGHGSLKDLQDLVNILKQKLGCWVFWSFPQSHCWECLVTIRGEKRVKNSEVQSIVDNYYKASGVSVDFFGRGCSDSLLACITRINKCRNKGGDFPTNLRARLTDYVKRSKQADEASNCEQITGRPYNTTSFLQLHQDYQQSVNENSLLATSLNSLIDVCQRNGVFPYSISPTEFGLRLTNHNPPQISLNPSISSQSARPGATHRIVRIINPSDSLHSTLMNLLHHNQENASLPVVDGRSTFTQ